MRDRPIGENAERRTEAQDDVPGEADGVADVIRDDLDAVQRLVAQARTGHGSELDEELDAVASAMQRELNKLESERTNSGEWIRARASGPGPWAGR